MAVTADANRKTDAGERGPVSSTLAGVKFALRQGLTAARRYARSWTDGTRAYASGVPCRVRSYDLNSRSAESVQ
jgi:hypothetical protein